MLQVYYMMLAVIAVAIFSMLLDIVLSLRLLEERVFTDIRVTADNRVTIV